MTWFEALLIETKRNLVGVAPEILQPLTSVLLSILPVIGVFMGLFALTTLVERKGLGRIQNRPGPNRVGPCGILQPVADGIKMLIKEDIVPAPADRVVHFLAPVVLMLPAFLAFAVIPYGPGLVPVDLDAGVLFFFAVGAAAELTVFMAGWSSRNKYALLGAMRAIAQMISYEIPLILASVSVLMISGSLSLVKIVNGQGGSFLHWYVMTPWGVAACVLFLISALAEANRSPFDIPEAESELIAGHMTEYSGFKYALFFLAEYIGLFAMSGLAVTLFLGGYHPPFAFLGWVPAPVWFLAKLYGLIALFIWVRGTLPRLRVDQLMNLAWKFMIPMALIVIVAAGVWHFLEGGWAGWLLCSALMIAFYWWLGGRLALGHRFERRVYRMGD